MSVDGATDTKLIKLPSLKDSEESIEMVDVFELDDEVYQMPKNPSAGIALEYLKRQSEGGPDRAIYYMLARMLGEDVYDLLMEHPSLTQEHLEQIIQVVEEHMLGATQGKNQNGSHRQKGSKKSRGSGNTSTK